MGLRKIAKMFAHGNVCVTGLRGTGKDMLTSNVINYRRGAYISNMDYKSKKALYIPLDFSKIDVKNNYKELIKENIVPYEYPYPERCDVYLSDAGIYFPSQYCNELNKQYDTMPVFQALSRQLGECNFHINVQNLNRLWDKIREQSDTYIMCLSCHVFKKWVIQKIRTYDKYEACVNRVEPFRPIRPPVFSNPEQRALMRTKNEELLRAFKEKNGTVKNMTLIYRNKSGYDTRYFKKLLKGEKNRER